MDDAINRALAAAHEHPTVRPYLERAVGLARFQAHERDGPFRHEPLSSGVPQRPQGALLPALHEVRGDSLAAALEALQVELVWAADCAEYSDATANARQYLQAAGHVDLAAQAALALAGPGLGLVLMPPDRVWGLAAGLGRQVSDLIAEGESSMGMLPASPMRDVDYSASYRWDMYHERPVSSAADLGRRELITYSVRFPSGRARCEAGLGEPGHFFLDTADTDAFTLTWYAETPDWALPPVDHALDTLAARISAGQVEHLEFRPAVPAIELARALGAPEAFARTVDVHMSSWRLDTPAGALRIGDFSVEATLANYPAGEDVPGLELPAARAVVLTPGDVVRHLYARHYRR